MCHDLFLPGQSHRRAALISVSTVSSPYRPRWYNWAYVDHSWAIQEARNRIYFETSPGYWADADPSIPAHCLHKMEKRRGLARKIENPIILHKTYATLAPPPPPSPSPNSTRPPRSLVRPSPACAALRRQGAYLLPAFSSFRDQRIYQRIASKARLCAVQISSLQPDFGGRD